MAYYDYEMLKTLQDIARELKRIREELEKRDEKS